MSDSTDTYMTWLVAMIVNAVIFGTGATIVLATPVLAAKAATLMPLVVIASVMLSIPISQAIAPRMRLRYQREQNLRNRLYDHR